jgi:hypothetical protein
MKPGTTPADLHRIPDATARLPRAALSRQVVSDLGAKRERRGGRHVRSDAVIGSQTMSVTSRDARQQLIRWPAPLVRDEVQEET